MVEGQKEASTEEKAELPKTEVGEKALLDRLAQLESTNERLLAQSKENADKYRSMRDAKDASEKEELLKQENYKGLLGKKNEEYSALEENFNTLKKTALKKDLDFTVAKLIDKPLANGASVDDVIEQVLKTGVVEILEDESGFANIEEAYNKVKESKAFLFDAKKSTMINAVPSGQAPSGKKLSQGEQLSSALESIFKNRG